MIGNFHLFRALPFILFTIQLVFSTKAFPDPSAETTLQLIINQLQQFLCDVNTALDQIPENQDSKRLRNLSKSMHDLSISNQLDNNRPRILSRSMTALNISFKSTSSQLKPLCQTPNCHNSDGSEASHMPITQTLTRIHDNLYELYVAGYQLLNGFEKGVRHGNILLIRCLHIRSQLLSIIQGITINSDKSLFKYE